tara:strand:+ start:324 stop:944 length:621 start_codon:yes stop_codon:yes gene_type:complete
MNFLGKVVKGIVRGGLVKKVVKEVSKALPKVFRKGVKRTMQTTTRGVKSTAAQARALPGAIYEAGGSVRSARMFWGGAFNSKDAVREFSRVIGVNLSKASKKALNTDTTQRLGRTLSRIGLDKGKSRAFKKLLQNAKANETWGQLWFRTGKKWVGKPKKVITDMLRGGAENLAIDETGKALVRAGTVLAGGVATGVSTGVVMNKKK